VARQLLGWRFGEVGARVLEDGVTGGAEVWRRRAEELQVALDSRVVIEQAKGMLRERIGLPIESAFSLLRSSARGNGRKLHGLAAEVVDSFATPEPIVQELARHPEFMTMPRTTRIIQTEEFYRQLNDLIARNGPRADQRYMCECANPYCNETMDVTTEDITTLHSMQGSYVILPGHEIPDVEHVVRATTTYTIVAMDGVARRE
jgi:ANTAR domain